MPRTTRSLQITDIYRGRLLELQHRAEQVTTTDWHATVDLRDLDATHPAWAARAAAALTVLQIAGVRLTAAYLAAFMTSELVRPVAPPALDATAYVGVARTGKPLTDALTPTVITVKQAITAGEDRETAGRRGLHQAVRLARTETLAPPRAALADTIHHDPRIIGWRRVTAGGCGACLAAATETYGADVPMLIHDGCRCGAEPVLRNVPDEAIRPDGHDLFAAMTDAAQDALLGAEKAQLIRSGRAALRDLIAISPMVAIPDQITEAPLQALQAHAA